MDAESSEPLDFTIIEGCIMGRSLVVSSDGYAYILHRKTPAKTIWKCFVDYYRLNGKRHSPECSVTLEQIENRFFSYSEVHNHEPEVRMLQHILPRNCLKEIMPMEIETEYDGAEFTLSELYSIDGYSANSSGILKRRANANLFTKEYKPEHPADLKTEINTSYISYLTSGNFFRKDFRRESSRHLIFATDQQLELLMKTKVCFISSTDKLTKYPFCQVLSIHTFGLEDEKFCMVPLVSVVMSHKSQEDYIGIFSEILKLLPSDLHVKTFVIGSDLELLKGLQFSFINISIRIGFHNWNQTLSSLAVDAGLKNYSGKSNVDYHTALKRLFVLPLMPNDKISMSFSEICSYAADIPELQPVLEYVGTNWLVSDEESSFHFSMFGSTVDDKCWNVDMWHKYLLHRKCKNNRTHFYNLVPILYKVACDIPVGVKLVTKMQLDRIVREKTSVFQLKLDRAWKEYKETECTDDTFLEKLSKLFCFYLTLCHKAGGKKGESL